MWCLFPLTIRVLLVNYERFNNCTTFTARRIEMRLNEIPDTSKHISSYQVESITAIIILS